MHTRATATNQSTSIEVPNISETMAVVGKKIIVFCDGTGNDIINSKYPTNISILHENLTRTDGDDIRAVLYFEGVGVSRDNTSVLLDSINANSLDYILMSAYIGIVSNYVPSDRIYLFGFSRGAFTVRCLYNFIFRYGILTKATHTAVKCLYSHYKNYNKSGVSTEQIELYPVHEHSRYTVDFLGLFDTVSGLSQKQEREHDFFLRADDNTTRFCHIMSMDVNFMYSNLSFFGQMKNVENSRNASRFAVVTVDRPYVRVDNTNAGFENFLLRPDQQHARNDLHFWLIPQYEMMYPGDHCSVGGGWEEFPRGVNRILSNYSLYFVARASRLRFDDIYNNADLNMHNEENEVVVATSYPASLDIAARLPAFANVFEQLTRSNSIFAFGSMRAYFMRFIGYRISQFCLFHLRGRIVYRVGRREGRYLDENLDPSFLNRLFMNIYNISVCPEEAFLRSLELKSTNEDDMLAEAIEKNSSYKQTVKSRVSASPMPNPDKLKNQNALRAKLEESRKLRTSQSLGTPTETKKSKPGVKKPVKAQVHTLGTS